jgi:hypothetical protein
MKKIIDFLDEKGSIDDECVSYGSYGPYPFTIEEFREYTHKLWEDAGGWDASEKYLVEGARFETYNVPFESDSKKYVLRIMYGQGSAWTLLTEAAHNEHKEYLKKLYEEEEKKAKERFKKLIKKMTEKRWKRSN